jgi:carbamoyl-phosphate synthase small subunit
MTEKITITDSRVKPCLLALEDGKTYAGKSFGAEGTATGELVFNTSLYGYQEILTDPSYAGQVITLTTPEEGKTTELGDDRAADEKKLIEIARQSPDMNGLDLTREVTCDSSYTFGDGNIRVAVLDFGIKQNILNLLAAEGFALTVYPSNTTADAILKNKPDGIFLSNGPGDPAACADVLRELPKLIDAKIPIFGICLGHQLLSLALGARTYKLKFGHRGGNQPVKDLLTGKVEITCQNHGFAVDKDSVPEGLEITHVNLNDGSVEGFRHKHLPIFAVQYHPEAHPGPNDSNYLFARFTDLVKSDNKAKVI